MISRREFVEKIAPLNLSRAGQAIALLWFYRQNQIYDERTASELADDLQDAGIGRPNVTELHRALRKSPITVKGRRPGTFQINVKHLEKLNKAYGQLINLKTVNLTSSILPQEIVLGTRLYIERMVAQINGTYDVGFYDACAVILRRLMESLIIEVFIKRGGADLIKKEGKFIDLEDLIDKISSHPKIHLGRNSVKTMSTIKILGDTAAHDRTYITQQHDIDDQKQNIRKVIQELLSLSGITK